MFFLLYRIFKFSKRVIWDRFLENLDNIKHLPQVDHIIHTINFNRANNTDTSQVFKVKHLNLKGMKLFC